MKPVSNHAPVSDTVTAAAIAVVAASASASASAPHLPRPPPAGQGQPNRSDLRRPAPRKLSPPTSPWWPDAAFCFRDACLPLWAT
ncbi:hypothetical protein F4810DRAFT_706707 [Camillea tinctor]|nr:hypothetical protein F4810DRAFT_706707 [Camillea tinctor]